MYRQLKHSTRQAEDEFTVSGLKKTLEGFGTVYRKIKTENADELTKVRFEFVSNRQVRSSVRAESALFQAETMPPEGAGRFRQPVLGRPPLLRTT